MEYRVDEYNNSITELNGYCHSFDDKPAIISKNGDQYWYKKGRLHRDSDLPAIIKASGAQYWYKEGKLHRDSHFPGREDDLPAVIWGHILECWKNGEYVNRCYGQHAQVKSARNI